MKDYRTEEGIVEETSDLIADMISRMYPNDADLDEKIKIVRLLNDLRENALDGIAKHEAVEVDLAKMEYEDMREDKKLKLEKEKFDFEKERFELEKEKFDFEKERFELEKLKFNQAVMNEGMNEFVGLVSPIVGLIGTIISVVSSRKALKHAMVFERMDQGGVLPTKFINKILK